MFTGVLLTGLFVSPLQAFYERDARGTLTWPQVLHVPYGTVVFLVALMAIAAFVVAERVEGVRRGEAPREMMAHYRRALAVAALALGGLAALVRSPVPTGSSVDIAALARAVEREDDHVTAVELATWIKDRKPGLRVIDVRSAAEFDTFHVPTAERVALEALVTAPFTDRETIVLYSDGGTHAAQGWVFLRARGLSHVYFLRGGLADWLDDVMNPTLAHDATPEARAAFERVVPLSRYFGGAPRRETATDPAAQATTPRSSVADAVARMRRRGC
jgi:rhodanese-related sulfurtransferase